MVNWRPAYVTVLLQRSFCEDYVAPKLEFWQNSQEDIIFGPVKQGVISVTLRILPSRQLH